MFYTYILHLSNNNLYAGSTDNLKRRYYEHINGKVESTKNLRPLKLIFYEAFSNEKDAERRERYFKTDKGKKMLKVMLREYFNNNPSGIV
jgi:putative endonuclease